MTGKEAILSETCSYLGFRSDPGSLAAYPSAMNYCHKCQPRTIPALVHQREFCLSREHKDCPVFQAAESEKMPRELIYRNGQSAKSSASLALAWDWVIGLLIIGMIGLAFAFFRFRQPVTAQPEWTPPQTSTPNSFMPVLMTIATAAAEVSTTTISPTSTSPSGPATPQPSFTATDFPPQIHALEIPIMIGEQPILMHRALEGEQIALLAKHNKTTIEALQAINSVPPAPLLLGKVIVIAPGLLVVDPSLPKFTPYEVTDQEISVEDLAGKLSVDLAVLKYYNRCSAGCRLVRGDWLLLPPLVNTPTPTSTPQPSPTPTRLLPQAHALDVPIMIGEQPILMHRVIEGEQIILLAKHNQTTVEVLQAINYLPPVPLIMDGVIVIAPGLQVIDPLLPSFEPYQVIDQEISVEDLAGKLGVDLILLKYYNRCPDAFRLVKGDWLLIPRVK